MIVAVAAVSGFSAVVFFNPVMGVFISPLSEQFGWTRTEMSLAVTIGSGAAALASPAVGWIMDRWGGRWVMTAAAALMGLCLLALAGMSALWQLYVFYSLGRSLAQSASQTAAFVSVSNWFIRRRPLAVAIVSLGQRVGMALIPVAVALVIGAGGWRLGWIVLAVTVLGAGVAPPLLLMRRRPEDVGLRPDGDAVDADPDADLPPAQDSDWSLRGAVRTRAYWLVGFGVAFIMFSAGSINLHQIPHLQDQGLGPAQAALVVSVYSIAAAGGGLLGGAVATRLGVRRTLTGSLVGQAGGVVLLIMVAGPLSAMVYAVWYGVFFGSTVTLNQVIYADYFGRRSLGVIRGSFQPVQMAFNAAGPLLAGFWFDRAGSYDAVFVIFVVLFLAAAVFFALSAHPHRPAGATSGAVRRSA